MDRKNIYFEWKKPDTKEYRLYDSMYDSMNKTEEGICCCRGQGEGRIYWKRYNKIFKGEMKIFSIFFR